MQFEKLTFESIVENAINGLPKEVQEIILDADIIIEREANTEQLLGSGLTNTDELLGISEIIPSDEKYGFGELLPSKIILFKNPISNKCENPQEMISIISDELQNHFLAMNYTDTPSG
tara:strand:- start:30 stop:383 length:354 start_codon:yes stop_codon:yes gene_type:complete